MIIMACICCISIRNRFKMFMRNSLFFVYGIYNTEYNSQGIKKEKKSEKIVEIQNV